MALNRRNPIWPYLPVLACLFALSIAAPRGWQRSRQDGRLEDTAQEQPLPAAQSRTTAEVVRPTSIVDVGAPFDDLAGRTAASSFETRPQFEDAAEKIAENRRFDSAAELTVKPDHPLTLERLVWPPEENWPAPSPGGSASDNTTEASAASEPSLPADNTSATPAQPLPPPAAEAPATVSPAAPSEAALAQTSEPTQPSALQQESPQPSPPPAILQQEPSQPTPPPAIPPTESPSSTEPVLQPVPPATPTISGWPLPENLLARLDSFGQQEACRFWVDRVRTQIEQLHQFGPQEVDQAVEVLNQLRRMVREAETFVPQLPDSAAKADLRRIQYAIVRRLDVWEQICVVRRRTASSAAAEGTEGLLAQIERYETDGLTSDAHHLAEIRRELLSSPEPDEQELARRLNLHYRNANLRIAMSAALVDRLLPEQKPSTDAVNETILGNPVRGNSTTSARLSVQLIPDRRNWRFNLVATGTVDSRTRTTHGPVTFINCGTATYEVRKLVVVDTRGLNLTPAVANVDNSSELQGLYTSFDSVPLLRSVVRNYAKSQEEQRQNEADYEAQQKVAAKAMERVDSQANPRLTEAQENFNRNWIAPLRKLALDPAALAMETTDTRLSLRSRLAGSDQLGAHTPRPEAPSDSLASTQVHESTLNNLLDHLDLAGRTFTLPELHEWLSNKLSRGAAKAPDDLPAGVQVTFAQDDPIRVRCDGNHLELILRIAEIRDGRRHWHDFEVRAAYRPVSSGLAAQFERDGTIELGGQYKGKPEVALRGIFSKVLSRERKLNLFPDAVSKDPRLAGLEVTQLVVEDGWIATAIGPVQSAVRHSVTTKR